MTGRKRVEFRAKTRAVPGLFGIDRRSWPADGDFTSARDNSGESAGDKHRDKNSRPTFAAREPRNSDQDYTEDNVRGPIAHSAHHLHKTPQRNRGMRGHPGGDGVIGEKSSYDCYDDQCDDDQPSADATSVFRFRFHVYGC